VIEEGVTIKAIAVQDGYEQSTVSTFSYGFADQVATPQASYASGELEMGETISFFCDTEDAQIYYRTDGTEPDPSDKSSCELYTGPITIERATNFKVIAVKDHMQNSKVLTVGYTVREPEIVEVEEEEEEQTVVSGSSRLQSRHSYSDTESGPSYSAVVLRSAAYRAVVSAPEDVLPDNVQLKVEPTQVSDVSENMVKNALTDEYGIVSSYQISLLQDGEEIQPDGEIEIGLPIPSEYENSIIHIVYVQEDGSIKVYDTRRSSGFAYAKVDHLSTWAIAAPVEYTESKAAFPWLLVIYSGVVVLAGVGILLLYRARKERKEGEDWDV
jgi:hypothetical protein